MQLVLKRCAYSSDSSAKRSRVYARALPLLMKMTLERGVQALGFRVLVCMLPRRRFQQRSSKGKDLVLTITSESRDRLPELEPLSKDPALSATTIDSSRPPSASSPARPLTLVLHAFTELRSASIELMDRRRCDPSELMLSRRFHLALVEDRSGISCLDQGREIG